VPGHKKIIIHAGFHRCASTAVQDMLRDYRASIEALGTTVLLREDLEGWLSGRQLRLLYRCERGSLVSALRLKLAQRMLARLPTDRVVISEELLLGLMPGVRDAGFYPHFSNFLTAVKALAKSFDVELRFIARRQDRFLESVYAFRVPRGLRASFPDYVASIGLEKVSWLGLLRQVEEAGLQGCCRFGVLESAPAAARGQWAMDFLGLGDVATGQEIRLSGNRRRSEAELLDMLGAHKQVGFTDEERAAFLTQHAADNAAFLAHPMVDAPADVWND